MSLETSATGIKSIAAFKIEGGNYGTAETLGAGDALPFVSFRPGINHRPNFSEGKTPLVAAFENAAHRYSKAAIDLQGTFSVFALLALAMGKSHTDQSPIAQSSTYTHYFELVPYLADYAKTIFEKETSAAETAIIRGTLGAYNGIDVMQMPSCAVNGFSFTATLGGITFSFPLISTLQELNKSPNTSAAAWTMPEPELMRIEDLIVRLIPEKRVPISSSNNNIGYTEGVASGTLTIPSGNYSPQALAREIEIQAAASTMTGDFTAKYLPQFEALAFLSDTVFSFDSGDALETIGFPEGTGNGLFHSSTGKLIFSERADDKEEFQVPVTAITLNVEKRPHTTANKGSLEDISPLAHAGQPGVSVSLQMPRYITGEYWQASLQGGNFRIEIQLKGSVISSGIQREISFFIPSATITSSAADINGPKTVTESYTFQAVTAKRTFFQRDFETDYFISAFETGYSSFNSLNIVDGNLAICGDDGTEKIEIIHGPGNYEELISIPGGSADFVQYYRGKYYAFSTNGNVFSFTRGGSAALSTDFDSGIADVTIYDGKLYVLLDNAKIHVFDGNSWAEDDSNSGTGYALTVFNGGLYAARLISGDLKIYVLSAGSWAEDYDPSPAGHCSMCVHNGALYALSNDTVFRKSGGSWATIPGTSISGNIRHCISWENQLIFINASSDARIYYYDFESEAITEIAQISDARFIGGRPVVYQGNLLIPTFDNGKIVIMRKPPVLYSKIVNTQNTNPI